MNLPIFNELLPNQSNYINFSKSLSDLDFSIKNDKAYHLSKFVVLDLPNFVQDGLFINLEPLINSVNPNVLMPKALQYYTENIIRQSIETNEITEIAFWKTLQRFGMSRDEIKNSVVFMNEIVHSSFYRYENNNGWSEVLCKIPNNCGDLNTVWKTVDSLPTTYAGEFLDDESFFDDNANKEFDFTLFNEKIDFENSTITQSSENKEFKFNLILLFYTDADGVEKLHGINFINPFVNQNTFFELPRFEQRTNDFKNIGYQFKFNLKTVNNGDSRVLIENQNFQTDSFWAAFEQNLSGLNSLLSRFNKNLK